MGFNSTSLSVLAIKILSICLSNRHTLNISVYISNYCFSVSNIYTISLSSDMKWFDRVLDQLNLVHSVDWYWFRRKQLARHFSKPRLHKFTTTPLSWQTRSHTIHLHSQLACLLWSFPPRHEAVIWFIPLYYCFVCPSPCLCFRTHDESTARGQHTAKVWIWRHDEVKMWLKF